MLIQETTEILEAITTKERSEFTRMLLAFEKNNHTQYGAIDADVADIIFLSCMQILTNKEAGDLQRESALRLLRTVVTTEIFMQKRMGEVFNVILAFLAHTNGNIRNAAIKLLDRYTFGISLLFDSGSFMNPNDNPYEHAFVEQFLSLLSYEEDFLQKNPKIAAKESKKGTIPFSKDTKSPELKYIRRAIEYMGFRTPAERLAQKYGYSLPYSFHDYEDAQYPEINYF